MQVLTDLLAKAMFGTLVLNTPVQRIARSADGVFAVHAERKGEPDARQALTGLFFCANREGGFSVGDCILNAHHSAETVATHLRAFV